MQKKYICFELFAFFLTFQAYNSSMTLIVLIFIPHLVFWVRYMLWLFKKKLNVLFCKVYFWLTLISSLVMFFFPPDWQHTVYAHSISWSTQDQTHFREEGNPTDRIWYFSFNLILFLSPRKSFYSFDMLIHWNEWKFCIYVAWVMFNDIMCVLK